MANPTITNKEEWDVISAEFYPYFLDYLKTKGTAVDQIETYESVEGVKSLPARYDLGGVKKTVLVPIEVLGRDARNATEEARTSAANANRAASDADNAAARANLAAENADRARDDLEEVKSQTLAAASTANKAAQRANEAAENANDTNDSIKEEESKRVAAEQAREQAFRNALEQFGIDSEEKIEEFELFIQLARQEWENFVADYIQYQESIEIAELERQAAEQKRKEAETLRETAETERERKLKSAIDDFTTEKNNALKDFSNEKDSALKDVNDATSRFNTFLSNPPKISGDPATWWLYSEESEEYVDTGFPASGRSPYLDPDSLYWYEWNDEKNEYENTGINAYEPPIEIMSDEEIEKAWYEETDLDSETTDPNPEI